MGTRHRGRDERPVALVALSLVAIVGAGLVARAITPHKEESQIIRAHQFVDPAAHAH